MSRALSRFDSVNQMVTQCHMNDFIICVFAIGMHRSDGSEVRHWVHLLKVLGSVLAL